jgi:hypothetical protein
MFWLFPWPQAAMGLLVVYARPTLFFVRSGMMASEPASSGFSFQLTSL